MAFLANDAVNRVNLHSGIQAVAQFGGGVFLLAFLVQAGIGMPAALLAQTAIQALRFVLRPFVLPLAIRFGVKPLMLGGALVLAVQYPLLAQVTDIGWPLLLFCCVSAIGDVLYWPSYHTYFAVIGDAHHRGHQVSAREALVAAVGIVAPLLGAWALLALGPLHAFLAVAAVQAASLLPLLDAPNPGVRADAPNPFASARLAAQLAVTSGWFEGLYFQVWQVSLFVLLGHSYGAYGGAMALSALAGAAFGLLLGKFVDAGHGERTTRIAYGVSAAMLLLRMVTGSAPAAAVGSTTLGACAPPLIAAASGPPFYNLAQASPCPMRFHLVTEAGWDIGCGGACAVAAGLVAAGVPAAWTLLLALPALGAAWWLLSGYYMALAQPEAAVVRA